MNRSQLTSWAALCCLRQESKCYSCDFCTLIRWIIVQIVGTIIYYTPNVLFMSAPDEEKRLTPQEIVVISRADPSPQNTLAKAESTAKILSLLAIPVILAILGWVIQDRLAVRNVSQDYVKLAVSILTAPDASKVNPAMRDWAVDLLNQNSPTKFGADVVRQLKTGEVTLPSQLTACFPAPAQENQW